MNIILFVTLLLPLISCNPVDSTPEPLNDEMFMVTLIPKNLLENSTNDGTKESTCENAKSGELESNCGGSEIPQDLFKRNHNVVALTIKNLSKLEAWTKDDFKGADQLGYVEILNTVCDIPASIFTNIPLRMFVVENSKINAFDPTAFGVANQLETIKFQHDSLSSFPAGFFDSLTHLKKVFLTFNKFENIEAINLPEKNEIQSLDLAFNKITHLTDKSFHKLASVKFLVLAANGIDQISLNTFVRLRKLMLLDLSANNLEQLTGKMFEGIGGTLRFLDLGKNDISHIDAEAFTDLKHLETLILANNELTTLHPHTFAGLYNLQYLDLSLNKIQEMHHDLFKDLVNLERFDMKNGKLKSFDLNILGYTPNLKYIDISRNDISQLTEYTPKTASVKAASSDKNPPFSEEEERFYDEFVTRLTENMRFSFSPLGFQTIEVPDSEMIGDNKLLSIDMKDNKVRTLDKHFFAHLKNLRKFTMSRNPIELDYETFNEATKLEYLMLNECDFTSIDFEQLSHLPNLKYLFLADNALREINITAESRFESLEELDLSYNRVMFTSFSIKKESFPKLKKIDILGLAPMMLSVLHRQTNP